MPWTGPVILETMEQVHNASSEWKWDVTARILHASCLNPSKEPSRADEADLSKIMFESRSAVASPKPGNNKTTNGYTCQPRPPPTPPPPCPSPKLPFLPLLFLYDGEKKSRSTQLLGAKTEHSSDQSGTIRRCAQLPSHLRAASILRPTGGTTLPHSRKFDSPSGCSDRVVRGEPPFRLQATSPRARFQVSERGPHARGRRHLRLHAEATKRERGRARRASVVKSAAFPFSDAVSFATVHSSPSQRHGPRATSACLTVWHTSHTNHCFWAPSLSLQPHSKNCSITSASQ